MSTRALYDILFFLHTCDMPCPWFDHLNSNRLGMFTLYSHKCLQPPVASSLLAQIFSSAPYSWTPSVKKKNIPKNNFLVRIGCLSSTSLSVWRSWPKSRQTLDKKASTNRGQNPTCSWTETHNNERNGRYGSHTPRDTDKDSACFGINGKKCWWKGNLISVRERKSIHTYIQT